MKLTQKQIDKLFLKAIEEGDLTAVKYLLNESPIKANLHVTNEVEDPEYCLVVATQANQLEIFKYLLEETELKKYTKVSGIKAYVKNNFYDSLNIMYEYAGDNGNLEFIQYLTKNLQLEEKLQMFSYASLRNHIGIMDYLIKNEISNNDKKSLGSIKSNPINYALSHNSKEAVKYLLDYYKNSEYSSKFESVDFKVNALLEIIKGMKKDTKDFELFDYFFNDPLIKENEIILKNKEVFKAIAERKNFDLYTQNIEKIKDKEIKKEIILKTYYYAVEDSGTLSDYPLYTHILEKYKNYFGVKEKESIFYGLIYKNERNTFKGLMQYDFLKKGVDPNKILLECCQKARTEDTFNYIKDILQSEFKSKIKINCQDNIYFKLLNKELEEEKIIELLTLVLKEYPETKVNKLETIFEEKENVMKFIEKWKLNDKLEQKLPVKNISIKTMKI